MDAATTVESIATIPLGSSNNNNTTTNNNNNNNQNSSNTAMNCGSSSSSSSSSNSSGYASATTTPTNPASAGSQYSDSHSSTPVGMVEPTPVAATIAAITPYYNETFQQQQQQHHHSQHHHLHVPHQQYQQRQQQQQPPSLNSYQLAEQLVSPSPPQYTRNSATPTTYDTYPYIGGSGSGGESYIPQGTEVERNLLGMRHTTAYYTTLEKPSRLTPTQTQPLPLSYTANTHNSNSNSSSSSNKIYSNNNNEINFNMHKRVAEGSTPAKPQAAAAPFYAQALQATPASNAYLEPYKNTKLPSHKLAGHSIDNINYGYEALQATSPTPYAQNFSPYHSSSKMLQDVSYGVGNGGAMQAKTFTPLTNAQRPPQQRLGMHYAGNTAMPIGVTLGNAAASGSSGGSGNYSNSNLSSVGGIGSSGGGATYLEKYDKYLYNAVGATTPSGYYTSTQPTNLTAAALQYNSVAYAATAQPSATSTIPPQQFGGEITSDIYRSKNSAAAAAAAAASSYHWSVEYANGNYRTLPPPPPPTAHNSLPTAAIPPSNASFLPANATVVGAAAANRDIYYTPEKYGNKYDKYNTYYNSHHQQHYVAGPGRSVWPNSPHLMASAAAATSSPLTDRLPHHATYAHHAATLPPNGVPTAHPSLTYHHAYAPPSAAAATRQNCCSQSFQQENCYYPRTAHPYPHSHFFANTYNPHAAPHPPQATPPYAISASSAAHGNTSNSAAGKYGTLDYTHVSKTTKVNTNDLYAANGVGVTSTTPTYETENLNYHTTYHPPNVAHHHHNQQYSNPVAPTAVRAHETLNANITAGGVGPPHNEISTSAYYTDLNLQPSYENYVGTIPAPPSPIQPRRESLVQRVEHLPNLSTTYTQPNASSNPLVDYRKTTSLASDDCFMGETTLTNLDEHMASNMNNYDSSGSFGLNNEIPLSADLMYGKSVTEESTEKDSTVSTPTTKTYSSLRDFLSTWNEDEDDYGCAAELKFVENVPQLLEQSVKAGAEMEDDSSNHDVLTNKISTAEDLPRPSQSLQIASEVDQLNNGTKLYSMKASTSKSMTNMVSNQYTTNMNLPDIIIDIEKSSGATQPIQPSNAPKTHKTDENVVSNVICNTTFDVEKELDELETNKSKLSKISPDLPAIRIGSVIKKAQAEIQVISTEIVSEKRNDQSQNLKAHQRSFEFVNTVSYPCLVKKVEESELTSTTTVQAKPDSSSLNDRGIENDNTTSSNSSTFEKAYETFINKIGNEYDLTVPNIHQTNDIETPDISSDIPQKSINNQAAETLNINIVKANTVELSKEKNVDFSKQSSDSDLEIAQKIKSYSKFYKRKRTYSKSDKDNECKKLIKSATAENNTEMNSNFPLTCQKSCRKREGNSAIQKIRLKLAMKARNRHISHSFYQRILRTLRRQHILRKERLENRVQVKERITAMLESHLQLNKRKSLQLNSDKEEEGNSKYFNPETLKFLSVSFINSDAFRQKLLKNTELKSEVDEKKAMKNHAEHRIDQVKKLSEILEPTSVEANETFAEINSVIISQPTTFVHSKENLADYAPNIEQNGAVNSCKKRKLNPEFTVINQSNADLMKQSEIKNSHVGTYENSFEESAAGKYTQETDFNDGTKEIVQINAGSVDDQAQIAADAASKSGTKMESLEQKASKDSPIASEFDIETGNLDETKTKPEDAERPAVTATAECDDSATLKGVDITTNASDSSPKDMGIAQVELAATEEVQNIKHYEEPISSACGALIRTEEAIKNLSEEPLELHSTTIEVFKSPAINANVLIDEQVDAAKVDQSTANPIDEYDNRFSEEELQTISLHLRRFSKNMSTNDPELLEHGSFIENEEITRNIETDNIINHLNDIHEYEGICGYVASNDSLPQVNNEGEPLNQNQCAENRNIDLSEGENSVDMFGARKYVEYYTTASKNYFEKPLSFDENSTDSSSSSSSDSSSSSASEHQTVCSSSSAPSSSSDDEDTQSSTSTVQSGFDEMKELEKELSQHQINETSKLCSEKDKENEKKTEEVTSKQRDDSSDNVRMYTANDNTTDNDIKVLKKILESDSDGQEDVKTENEKNDADKKEHDKILNVEVDIKCCEHSKNDTIIEMGQDKELAENEGSCALVEESMTLARLPLDDANELLKECEDEKLNDVANTRHLACEIGKVEENHTPSATCLHTPLENTDEGTVTVPKLRNIILDFLERENSIENNHSTQMIKRTEDALLDTSKIPKLSDLCKIALSSSFELSTTNTNTTTKNRTIYTTNNTNTTNITNQNVPNDKVDHELSVEEALAEMYRQVGVVTSDIEDGDGDGDYDAHAAAVADGREAQNVVLINLEEILVNDSDLYVLQCDMNENVLSVVAHAQTNNLPIMINESIDDRRSARENEEESAHKTTEVEVEMMTNASSTTTNELGPFMGVDGVDGVDGVEHFESDMEIPYTAHPHHEYIADDLNIQNICDDSFHAHFDFPAIHHEEIVSHHYKRHKRQLLYNSLREKYVLRKVNFKTQHGNRVLKKYIHRWILQCLIARFRERELRRVQMYVKE